MNKYIPGLVSIIMPSYNTGKFIRETIESVQNQTYTNWEILLVDDCSTDNTLEIISRINDPRIRVYVNGKNSGAAVSRNKALREASGEWIAFLDSDDLWVPQKLEKQLKFMVENNYRFTCAYSTYIDEESRPLDILDTSPKEISKLDLYVYNWIGCLTAMYHYPSIGLVQIEDIKKRNDYALWLKVIKKADCYCLHEILGQYRVRKKSVSHCGIIELIKNHYLLFRICENKQRTTAVILVILNILFGIYRKLIYAKHTYNNSERGI